MGALKAIEDAGLAGKIKVYGIDATQDAAAAVKAGRLMGTVFQDAAGQGKKAIDVAVQIAKGQKVDKLTFVPYLPVDKGNVDKYSK